MDKKVRDQENTDASTSSVSANSEKIMTYFEKNPYTVNTVRQISLWSALDLIEAEKVLKLLAQKGSIQEINYRHDNVYRYIPKDDNN